MSEDISIFRNWVSVEDYEFKILVLTSFLADSNLAYRGNLTTICNWLGIGTNQKNRNKIKESIKKLEEKEYIFCNKEGQTYHISITNKGLKDKRVVKIKKQWLEVIKNYGTTENKVNNSWASMLKALIVIFDRIEQDKQDFDLVGATIITMKELGEEIQKSEQTAGKIINKLVDCDFKDGLTIKKEIIKQKYKDNNGVEKYKTFGTQIQATYEWEK